MSSQNKPIDFTKPVQTRDGKPARILCTDRITRELPVVALILLEGNEQICSFHPDGRYRSDSDSDFDLINVPPKVVSEGYSNVYRDGSTGKLHITKDAAQSQALSDAIGLIKITTYDDGTFDIEKV